VTSMADQSPAEMAFGTFIEAASERAAMDAPYRARVLRELSDADAAIRAAERSAEWDARRLEIASRPRVA
jgi:hypothetical protein